MRHYKPLFMNPAISGGFDVPQEIADLGLTDAWNDLCAQVERQEGDPNELTARYENSSAANKSSIVDSLMLYTEAPDEEILDGVEVLLSFADSEEFEDDEGAEDEVVVGVDAGGAGGAEEDLFVGPPSDPVQESLAEVITASLADVFPGKNLNSHDIFFVLLEGGQAISDSNGMLLDQEDISNALTSFGAVSFPQYMPEELITLIFNESVGDNSADLELEAMLEDSHPQALCTPENVRLVRARFGENAAQNLQVLCELPVAQRVAVLIDQHNGDIASLLGVSASAFQDFILDSFNNQISDALIAAGGVVDRGLSDQIRTQIDTAKTQTPEERRGGLQGKATLPALEQNRKAANEGSVADKLAFGIIAIGSIASVAMLVRKSMR